MKAKGFYVMVLTVFSLTISAVFIGDAFAVYPKSFEFEEELGLSGQGSEGGSISVASAEKKVQKFEKKIQELNAQLSANASADIEATANALEEKTNVLKTKLDEMANASGQSRDALKDEVNTAMAEAEQAYQAAIEKTK